jgi:hypothetical protein
VPRRCCQFLLGQGAGPEAHRGMSASTPKRIERQLSNIYAGSRPAGALKRELQFLASCNDCDLWRGGP